MALRAHFDTASGLHGPRPIVTFRFFIYTDSQQPFVGLSHQVLVHAMVNDASVPIGPAYLPGAHRFDRASGSGGPKVNLVLPIDFATLRWMEDQRSGRGGVTFYFDWAALGHEEGGTQLANEPVSLAIGGTPFPVHLPQETWLDLLRDVRYRDVAVVEIPLTDDQQNVLARSHEHLETARERLYRADDRGVLVACGEALDVLANARQVKLSKEYGYDDLIEDLTAPIFDSDRKAERLGKVLSGVRQMCLSGKHDEAGLEGRPIPVDHHDAVMAFLMTASAISYLEQLPLEMTVNDRRGIGGRPRTRRRSRGGRGRGNGEGLAPAPQAAQGVQAAQPPQGAQAAQSTQGAQGIDGSGQAGTPAPFRDARAALPEPAAENAPQRSRRRRGRRGGGSGAAAPAAEGAGEAPTTAAPHFEPLAPEPKAEPEPAAAVKPARRRSSRKTDEAGHSEPAA